MNSESLIRISNDKMMVMVRVILNNESRHTPDKLGSLLSEQPRSIDINHK